MKHKHPHSLKKAALAAAVVTALGTGAMIETAQADVYDFSFSGYFTMIDSTGKFVPNTSAPYYSNAYSGFRSEITGTVHYDTATGTGTATITPFDFFNQALPPPATAYNVGLQYIGDGNCTTTGCGAGSLILGNMLFDWNGNLGIPVSIVWDASGMLNAISGGGLAANDIITGTGATPASNSTKASLQIGVAPVATTTWNTTPTCTTIFDTTGHSTGNCMSVNPSGALPLIVDTIGGSPMIDGPFIGFNANFDFTSMTVTCINNVCGPSQLSSTLPADGATNAGISTTVSVTFTQPMQADTVASAFTLSADGGLTALPGTMSPNTGNATTFTFTPSTALLYSTTYTATVTAAALDAANNPFTNAPFVWTFTTRAKPVTTACTPTSEVPLGSNFTMLDPKGNILSGGTNDILYTWDGTTNTTVNGTNFNMTLASVGSQPFFGFPWTAHDIRVFGPGTYTFNTGCTVAELHAGTPPDSCAVSGAPLTMTVGAGQYGAHMLFNWNGNNNIDVVNIWDQNAIWDTHGDAPPKNSLWTGDLWLGPAGVTSNPATTWLLVSTDNDGDGINGVKMVDGPFIGYSANFNLSPADSCQISAPIHTDAPDVNSVPGCSISTIKVNPLERGDWWLLAGFVAWLGIVRRRFRRQRQS